VRRTLPQDALQDGQHQALEHDLRSKRTAAPCRFAGLLVEWVGVWSWVVRPKPGRGGPPAAATPSYMTMYLERSALSHSSFVALHLDGIRHMRQLSFLSSWTTSFLSSWTTSFLSSMELPVVIMKCAGGPRRGTRHVLAEESTGPLPPWPIRHPMAKVEHDKLLALGIDELEVVLVGIEARDSGPSRLPCPLYNQSSQPLLAGL
jgi:hypothetical protein